MAWAYHIYMVDPDSDIIQVEHVFYARSKAECIVKFEDHLGGCTALAADEDADRIEEEWEYLTENELPRPNEEDEEEEDEDA